jgi:putative ABC transport system permease protein
VLSASLRKSVNDLTRRWARAVFTVLTLALAVASVSFFAIPTLIDDAMQQEVRDGRLADVTVSMRPIALGSVQLDALSAIPNVAAVEPRSSVDIRVFVGERRVPARVLGVRDFATQAVDLVRVESGAIPGANEVLSDVQNANTDLYAGRAGDTVRVAGGGQQVEEIVFRVSGRGRSLPGGEQVQDENVVVFYAPDATVRALSGEAGYSRLAFRLRDPSPAAAATTVDSIRTYLTTQPGFQGFTDLPDVRAPGDWPGKGETEKFSQLLTVITVLALLSALVLIANTMSTLVAEQTGEIGVMRAIGARRRQVAGVYVRTAVLMGAFGAVVGVAIGILISNALARSFGRTFWAVDVGFGVDPAVLAVSVVAGLVAPPLAALPAIRRGLRTDLRAALEATGAPLDGHGLAEGLLRRARFLPRTMQIGIRSVGRRKRRSLATAAIVALAVGNLLAILGLATGVTQTTRAEWDDHLEDVRIWTTGRQPFDARAEQAILSVSGVAEAQPALVNEVVLSGKQAFVWGVPRDPLIRYRMVGGRWFSAGEEQGRERVAVIERNLAEAAGVEAGDEVTLSTAVGPVQLRVVGVAGNQQEDGTVLFVPLTTLREQLGAPTGATSYWIRTTSPDHGFVDRTTTRIEDRLAAQGYEVANEITYVGERENVADNRTITTSIALLGFVVVAISMVGLVNAITTNMLERTREIGILRCIGARARHVRRIFTTEGLTIAMAGWLLGIPLGYAFNRMLVWLVWEIVDVRVPVTFPPWNPLIALAGTAALALLVMLLPLRRATRLRPGNALRHA